MTTFVALFFTIPISFACSTILVVITGMSLRTTLEENAVNNDSVAYWVPYTITMLYLVPLFVALLFGVATVPEAGVDPAFGMTRILAGILGGCLLALTVIGIKLSGFAERSRHCRILEDSKQGRFDD